MTNMTNTIDSDIILQTVFLMYNLLTDIDPGQISSILGKYRK